MDEREKAELNAALTGALAFSRSVLVALIVHLVEKGEDDATIERMLRLIDDQNQLNIRHEETMRAANQILADVHAAFLQVRDKSDRPA